MTVYTVVDDSGILGKFTSKAKAALFSKEMRAQGRVPRVRTSEEAKPKASKPKASKPKASKPKASKPKASKPKASKPKAQPREMIGPAEPRPKRAPRLVKLPPREMIGPDRGRSATVSGRDLKRFLEALSVAGVDAPLSSGKWSLDDAHVLGIQVQYPEGTLLGLDWPKPYSDGIRMMTRKLSTFDLKGLRMSDTYVAVSGDDGLILEGKSGRVEIPLVGDVDPKLDMPTPSAVFEVSPQAFDREVRRAQSMTVGKRGWGNWWLYEDEGDLMIDTGTDGLPRAKADVGDARSVGYGDKGVAGSFGSNYLITLAKLISASDPGTLCTIAIQKDYPLEARLTVGGIDLRVMIASTRKD